jgi:hypothetical protein
MQNMPTPIPEPMVFPSIPKFSSPVPQMPTREEIQMAIQNIPAPAPVFTPAQTIQEKIQAVIQNMPVPIQRPGPVPDPIVKTNTNNKTRTSTKTCSKTSPNNSRKNTSGNAKYANANCSRFKHAKV